MARVPGPERVRVGGLLSHPACWVTRLLVGRPKLFTDAAPALGRNRSDVHSRPVRALLTLSRCGFRLECTSHW